MKIRSIIEKLELILWSGIDPIHKQDLEEIIKSLKESEVMGMKPTTLSIEQIKKEHRKDKYKKSLDDYINK